MVSSNGLPSGLASSAKNIKLPLKSLPFGAADDRRAQPVL
jgi:hypothetical protein